MSYVGKKIRLHRFTRSEINCGIIVPIDHGLTVGPLNGINSIEEISNWINHRLINGIIAHKGMVEKLALANLLGDIAIMIHLNGMNVHSLYPNNKQIVTTIESALALGADGVSIQLNFDGTNDAHNISLLGNVVDQAQKYGLPVLTMIYDKVVPNNDKNKLYARLIHLIRISYELGTDAIKIAAPNQCDDIFSIIDNIPQGIHTFFAGGELMPDNEALKLIKAISTTARSGICMGRNIFSRKHPSEFLDSLADILKE